MAYRRLPGVRESVREPIHAYLELRKLARSLLHVKQRLLAGNHFGTGETQGTHESRMDLLRGHADPFEL